ncbi:MAG: bifunctional transaldolase/phosoglucose isomerase, partial [Anaerolineales bacterium]|nr:bifunctional transaldolase/phosoglucose isomerase [Anaerolineales bacterium]
SVASFFISRVDTKIDAQLPNDSPLRGKAAIANAKLAYEFFQKYFVGNRFNKLQEKGARIQRPLWASTSTKNPAYPDTLYVDGLIGPYTENTVPPQTLVAYRDHGKVESALTRNLDEARQVIEDIEALGISMEQVTKELEEEGVKAFIEAFTMLLDTIDERRIVAISQLGPLQGSVAKRINRLIADNVPMRLFNLDATLWTDDPDQMAMIKKRMGWLILPETSRCLLPELCTLVNDIGSAGFTHVLLLGMGGSSLAPEVFSLVFGSSRMKFAILDSTDPYQLTSVVQEFPEGKTLYIISSKSGDTVEVQALFSYFWVREHADGSRFIAITDPGTSLEKLANESRFRKTIIADPMVGGRYSALTAFGLVPAALLGMDVDRLLMRAEWMEKQCAANIPTTRNPGLMLGAVFGQAALDGRDKLTIVTDPPLVPFCSWLEQLIAESSGKQGKGILPVIGEDLGDPLLFDNDRLFIYLRQTGEYDEALSRLHNSGHPVIVIPVKEIYDFGAEFYRWEIATVIACVILGVNPFDQPDVQDSKDRTNKKILAYSHNNILDEANPVWENDNIKIFSPDPNAAVQMVNIIDSFLSQSQVGDYCGINAFLPRNSEMVGILEKLRMFIRKKYCKVVTVGFGPRYLHSTGQFHKGGPNAGLFLQITAEPVVDVDIPNQQMTFGKLEFAQAIGDYEALKARSRRVLHLHILKDITSTLTALLEEMII